MNAYDTGFLDGRRQQSKEDVSEFLEDLKEIAIMINNHELARMKVEKWEKRL